MSPMGSQRNFGSPALLKRPGGALQHLKPGEMSSYQSNMWSNPFQAGDETQSYLQRLQAQQFPHIVPRLQSLEQLESKEKMEIYENPSEHYAAIKYGESNVSKVGGVQSLEPLLSAGTSSSAFGSHLLHPVTSRSSELPASSVNFYGYGTL